MNDLPVLWGLAILFIFGCGYFAGYYSKENKDGYK